MRRDILASLAGAGTLTAASTVFVLSQPQEDSTLHKALENAANAALADYDCEVGITSTEGGPYREPESAFVTVRRTEEYRVTAPCADTAIVEPPDTTEPPHTANVSPDTTVNQQVKQPQDTLALPGQWPDNEPAGMTALTHIRGDTKDWPGWTPFGSWNESEHVAVVDDPDARYGSAIEKRFHEGDASGWGNPNKGAFNGPGQTFPRQVWKEVYVRIVFRYSANWDWHSGGEKLWLANSGPGISGTSVQLRNGVIFVTSNFVGAPATHRFWMPIIQGSPPQRKPVWNRSILEGPYARLTRDGYHTIEYLKRMHDPGVANGFIRFWLDGAEYTRFAAVGSGDVQWADVSLMNRQWGSGDTPTTTGISTRIEFPMYWGGQGDTKTVDDWIRISEFYVSGR